MNEFEFSKRRNQFVKQHASQIFQILELGTKSFALNRCAFSLKKVCFF